MKTPILSQLSKYLETTPAYEPRAGVGEVLSRLIVLGKDVEPDGPLPSYQSDHKPETRIRQGFLLVRERRDVLQWSYESEVCCNDSAYMYAGGVQGYRGAAGARASNT